MGRCLYSWLHDDMLHEKIKEVLQKKLNSIKVSLCFSGLIYLSVTTLLL